MHVAILCEYGTVNGGENSILAMIERMEDVQVTVLAPHTGRLADRLDRAGVARAGFSLEDDAGRRLDRAAAMQRLHEIVRHIQPDLLHANSLAMGRLTGALRPALSIPTTAHLRDIIRLNRTAIADLNANDALIAVSRETARAHIEQGLDKSRTHIIYNGIDCDSPRSRESTPGPSRPRGASRGGERPPTGVVRSELGLSDSTRLVAAIGQITLRKGQDLFVRAAIDSAAALPDVHWLIIGERYSQKPETIAFDERMRRQVADAGLHQRIHWPGYRPDAIALLGEIDVLVHPARQEPLGRVLLEAAACGTPIVAADVGGTAEIIEHERTGLLIPPNDPPAIIAAVARLLGDDSFRTGLGTAAQQMVSHRFALAPRTAELTALWHKLVTAPSS